MKKVLSLQLFIAVLIACQLILGCHFHHKNHAVMDKHAAQLVSGYEGLYEGTLPCADCPGINTKLTLKKDKTFVYEIRYLEKDDGRYLYTGTYSVKEDLLTIHEDGQPVHFLIGDKELFLLDKDLKPATGELAPHYTLKKQK